MSAPAEGLTVAVNRITLTDFRNYGHARLEVENGPVVLTGANGAGKTNVLEALSYLVPGRGLRQARLADVARQDGNGGWAVAATLTTPDGPVNVGTGCGGDGSERRQVRVDGQTMRSQAALGDHLSAVWLTPRMDGLFQDGGAARRRFLDRMVFGFDPAHAGRLSAWDHAARARSKLLRDGTEDANWLAALEETMAQKGIALAAARADMVARLNGACGRGVGPFPGAALTLDGQLERWLAGGPALAAEDRLRGALRDARGRDAETGGAGEGPHRSDLLVHHVGRDMPARLCSTGEQKALLIALVLADARMQSAERGSPPLMLLDEVAAHLDSGHRAALFDEVLALGAQAWLTGTEGAVFAPLNGNANFITVDNGRLINENESKI